MGGKKYTQETKDKAIELVRSGLSTYRAAKQVEASQSIVHKWCVDADVTLKKQKKLTKKNLKDIKRWYRRKSTVEIGDRLEVSPSTIYRALKKMGVKIRAHKQYTKADINKAVRLHKAGVSINEISCKHIIRNGQRPDWQTVKRWLEKAEVSIKIQNTKERKPS